jgi:hypothetical protein
MQIHVYTCFSLPLSKFTNTKPLYCRLEHEKTFYFIVVLDLSVNILKY